MASQTKLKYSGPPALIVATGETLTNGDTVDVDEDLARTLLCNGGFDGPDRLKPEEKDGLVHDEREVGLPRDADGKVIEAEAPDPGPGAVASIPPPTTGDED